LIYKFAVKMKIHELGLTKLELVGKKADWLPYSLPNANAVLGIHQFKKLKKFREHRKKTSNKYYELLEQNKGSIKEGKVVGYHLLDPKITEEYAQTNFLRLPVLVENAEEFRSRMEDRGVYLGNWYTEVIHCKDVDMNCMLYTHGSCPNAEWLVKRIVNLPTHIGIGDSDTTTICEYLG
jgi:dTDP-4-amino-4,6-dideoxygalactose transaminase